MDSNKNNKDKENSMREEELARKFRDILIENYHYNPEQIVSEVSFDDGMMKTRADLVVYDKKKSPAVIVEIKSGRMILPLFEHQLKELMILSKSKYGILYNGTDTISYKLEDGFLIELDDIPRRSRGLRIDEIIERSKKFARSETQIWYLADVLRGRYGTYETVLQILALRIIDDSKHDGSFCRDILENDSADALVKLWDKCKEELPYIFSDDRIVKNHEGRKQIIDGLHTINDFSIKHSDIEVFTKAILKFGQNKDWADFPRQLSEFIVELSRITIDDKIFLPYCRFGNGYQIIDILEKKFHLENNSTRYLESHITGSEHEQKQLDITKLISLLRNKPIKILKNEFTELSPEIISQYDCFLIFPPLDSQIRNNDFQELGDFGNNLTSYIIMKLLREKKPGSKAILLTTPSFLASTRYQKIRDEVKRSGYLRGVIQLPDGMLFPMTGIPTVLIVLEFTPDFHHGHVFFAEIASTSFKNKTLDDHSVTKILNNFHHYVRSEFFKEDSTNFLVDTSLLDKSWSVSDKTPELQKFLKSVNGTRLADVAEIHFGKPKSIGNTNNEEKTPYVKIGDIKDGRISEKIKDFISLYEYSKEKYFTALLQENDVLVSCQGTIGKVALAEHKDINIVPSPQLAVLRANVDKILPEYLFLAMQTPEVINQLKIRTKRLTIPRLNKDDLEEIIIPIPTLERQRVVIESYRDKKKRITQLEKSLKEEKQDLFRIDI